MAGLNGQGITPPVSLAAVGRQLQGHEPRRIWWRRWARRAAVTAVLRPNGSPETAEVLLIQRAERPGDPWSGHMSFPGGRKEKEDPHVYRTAVRELEEETGLSIEDKGRYVGRLSDVAARPWRWGRRPLVVTPFAFALDEQPEWRLDPAEVADIVWVPLPFLADQKNRETMTWTRGRLSVDLPCYWYGGYRIWGLTLRMLDELITVTRPI